MPDATICKVCASSALAPVFSINRLPVYLVPLPAPQAQQVVRAPLHISECSRCRHLQAVDTDTALQTRLYEEYYSHYEVDSSEALQPSYREPFSRFIRQLPKPKHGSRLLEIGCSGGERIALLSEISDHYVGLDPSARIHRAIERFPQWEFVHGYFPEVKPAGLFDVVVAQFILEHIPNPREFIRGVWQLTAADGMLVLQIPDVDFFIRSKQPIFFAHEHINYFGRHQLEILLELSGFEIVSWGEEGPSLICSARKKSKLPQSEDLAGAPAVRADSRAPYLNSFFKQTDGLPHVPFFFYGVGPMLFWLLDQDSAAGASHFVDDNPKYHGWGLPGYPHLIEGLSTQLLQAVPNVVLSLNSVYYPKVLQKLKAFGLPLTVYSLSEGRWRTEKLNALTKDL